VYVLVYVRLDVRVDVRVDVCVDVWADVWADVWTRARARGLQSARRAAVAVDLEELPMVTDTVDAAIWASRVCTKEALRCMW